MPRPEDWEQQQVPALTEEQRRELRAMAAIRDLRKAPEDKGSNPVKLVPLTDDEIQAISKALDVVDDLLGIPQYEGNAQKLELRAIRKSLSGHYNEFPTSIKLESEIHELAERLRRIKLGIL